MCVEKFVDKMLLLAGSVEKLQSLAGSVTGGICAETDVLGGNLQKNGCYWWVCCESAFIRGMPRKWCF
jgi:hypothetical protein